MSRRLTQLPDRDREAVLAALAALETSDDPVDADDFRALHDPALRATLADELALTGRVLLEVTHGYHSGYDDAVADRLAADGVGLLSEQDRAVLTLVVLHAVAIPRARGRTSSGRWTDAEEFDTDKLAREWSNPHLTATAIGASLRRLRDAGILARGHRAAPVPGPQFLRLTTHRSTRLWEDLVLLADPESMLADVIRRRRTRAPSATAPGGDR